MERIGRDGDIDPVGRFVHRDALRTGPDRNEETDDINCSVDRGDTRQARYVDLIRRCIRRHAKRRLESRELRLQLAVVEQHRDQGRSRYVDLLRLIVHRGRDGPETRDRNCLDHATDVERRARRARQGAGRGGDRVAETGGVDGQIGERRYSVHRRCIDDALELGRGVRRCSKPQRHNVLRRDDEVAVQVLDRHLHGGRDGVTRQGTCGLGEKHEARGPARDAARHKRNGWQP